MLRKKDWDLRLKGVEKRGFKTQKRGKMGVTKGGRRGGERGVKFYGG